MSHRSSQALNSKVHCILTFTKQSPQEKNTIRGKRRIRKKGRKKFEGKKKNAWKKGMNYKNDKKQQTIKQTRDKNRKQYQRPLCKATFPPRSFIIDALPNKPFRNYSYRQCGIQRQQRTATPDQEVREDGEEEKREGRSEGKERGGKEVGPEKEGAWGWFWLFYCLRDDGG